MSKINPKEQSQRLRASTMRWLLALVVVSLLAAPIAVQAELRATSLAYSWDTAMSEFFWGHVTIEWNGSWIPLLQEVYFDQLDRPPAPDEPQICADPTKTTRYAGWIEYGLPYLDNDPDGARGFQESRGWSVVDCDLNGDGSWDDLDLANGPSLPAEAVVLAECSAGSANCNILRYDELGACTVETEEHCTSELATKLLISVDTDCDGAIDDGFLNPSTGQLRPLCVYAEALTPLYEAGEVVWTFPLPVRISDKNGSKTLMLYPAAPTAVELASFRAEPQGRTVLVSWETASELDNLGFHLYRTDPAGGERVRLNDRLIPSQSLGSAVGSSYQFVDRSAEPGQAYHYWLEDIDLSGVGGMNGPAAAQMPRERLLPCRPRPAPMPVAHMQ